MLPLKEGLKIRKKLILFFSLALLFIAILSISSKIVIEDFIQEQSMFSKVINVSGKQRMLSQRIMLLIQSLNSQKFNDGYNIMKADLINCIQIMRKENENLAYGNKIDGISKITNSEIERSYFGKVNLYQRVNDFTQFAENSANKNDFNEFLNEYNIYKINSLLIDLDKAVTLYSNESDLQIKKLIGISYITLLSTILLLLLEFLIIFRPISNKISRQFTHFEDTIYNLKNEKHILEIETRSAQRALGNLVPRVEFISKFNTEKIKLASYYQSAKDKGGDWWGIYEFDKTKIVLIGDVSGHEAGSSIIAAAVSGYFEALSNEKTIEKHDFSNIFKHLNEFIQKIDNSNQMHMTMSVLIFNEKMDRVKFINAAHSFPYLVNYKEAGDTKITRFKSRGQTLGFKSTDNPVSEHDEEIKVIEYEFKEDSLICLFSNGLTANTDKEEKDFGEKNLKKFFEKNNFKNTELLTVVDKLIDEAYAFYEDQPIKDDITFILIKRN
jgi:serine phosphatase RsbU (regulator of sigma subunit)